MWSLLTIKPSRTPHWLPGSQTMKTAKNYDSSLFLCYVLQYNIGCICVNSLCYCLCSRIYDNIYMIRNSQCWYFLSNIISVICLYFCQYKWVPTACYQPLIIFDELKVCIQKGILVLFSLEFYCQSASTIWRRSSTDANLQVCCLLMVILALISEHFGYFVLETSLWIGISKAI